MAQQGLGEADASRSSGTALNGVKRLPEGASEGASRGGGRMIPLCVDTGAPAESVNSTATAGSAPDREGGARASPLPGRLASILAEARQPQQGANDTLVAAAAASAAEAAGCKPNEAGAPKMRKDVEGLAAPDGFAASELGVRATQAAWRGPRVHCSCSCRPSARQCVEEARNCAPASPSRSSRAAQRKAHGAREAIAGNGGEQSPQKLDTSGLILSEARGEQSSVVDAFDDLAVICDGDGDGRKGAADLITGPLVDRTCAEAPPSSIPISIGLKVRDEDSQPGKAGNGKAKDDAVCLGHTAISEPLPELRATGARHPDASALSAPLPGNKGLSGSRCITPDMQSVDIMLAPTTPSCAAPLGQNSWTGQEVQKEAVTMSGSGHLVSFRTTGDAVTCQELVAQLCGSEQTVIIQAVRITVFLIFFSAARPLIGRSCHWYTIWFASWQFCANQ
jgi:hypothetical protein